MSEAQALVLPLVVTVGEGMRVEVGVTVGVIVGADGALTLDEAGLVRSIAEGLLLVAAMVLDGQPELADIVGRALDEFDAQL